MAAPQLTHYDVLGIARDADASEVRSAWKLHVQAWHPDRFSEEMRDEAERQTTRINEAYSVLRDSSRRAAYDCRLAADEAASRPEPAPRRAARPQPAFAPRAAAAPIGSPMNAPAQPRSIAEQAAAIGEDAWRLVRRHPRIVTAAACVWLLVVGASIVMHVVTGPTLPAGTSEPVSHSTVVADAAQLEDLEDLADRAREEAAQADKELEALLAEDARIAAEEAAAARREAQAAAKAKPAQKGAAKPGSGRVPDTTGDGRRIVRVMPQASAR